MFNRKMAKFRPRHTPGKMNKTEEDYSLVLQAEKDAEEIHDFMFEPIKLKLADLCYYSPDFMVLSNDGFIEFHEVKGTKSNGKILAEEKAIVKIKTAAEQFWMFKFKIVGKLSKKNGGGWMERKFNW